MIENIRFFLGNKVPLASLYKYELDKVDIEDVNGISALTRQIEGVEVGVTFKEKEAGVWKVSMRCNISLDVSKICAAFGGGGHRAAAGCKMYGNLDDCAAKLVEETSKYL